MCVWMLASCQESPKEAMLRLVQEWNGKEIKFPARSVFTIQGKDMRLCTGNYCGLFLPAVGDNSIIMYYKY